MTIPYLTLKDPSAAMALYEKALDASTTFVMDAPDGSIIHAEIEIHGTRMMVSGEWPGVAEAPVERSPVNFMVYVDNADAALTKAVEAGMSLVSEPETMFWGDRVAKANDGHGYEWTFAHEVEKVSPEDMRKRAHDWMKSMG